MLLWLLACAPASITLPAKDAEVDDTANLDSEDSGGDTGESGVDSEDTADSGDTGETAESGDSDTAVPVEIADFALTVDADMVLMLHATWTDPGATDARVEYRFEGDAWEVAPVIEPGVAVVLGIPAETAVEARLVATVDGEEVTSNTASATTGSLPRDLLLPTIEAWDETIALDAEYAMISVSVGDYTFSPPYFVEIFDRQGRIVWYLEVPDSMMCFYPSVSWDGTHIWWEGSDIFGVGRTDPFVVRQTLDGRWSSSLEVPSMGQAIGEGEDESFYYEERGRSNGVNRLDASGKVTEVWDCAAWMSENGGRSSDCYLNATNFSAARNTVLASGFMANTVFEIDLTSGEVIRQMGQFDGGDPWAFDPPESMFDYQHFVNWTDAGTLLASTHIRGRDGVQVAAEYTVDDSTQTLTRVWSYVSTDRWATQVGEALRLPNGNTVQGYGQDGAVREVTTDGAIAWEASWETDRSGYRLVGHLSLIPDLYALNVGPS